MLIPLLIACASPQAELEATPFAKAPAPSAHDLAVPRAGPVLSGLCDASTGTRRPDGTFLVGDDELNVLYPFSANGQPGAPLPLPIEGKEIDIEGSARAANGIWWVASHDRGKGTEPKPDRQHLFRTDDAGTVQADVRDLWAHLLAHPELGPLLRATEGTTSKDESGFSIEALHATSEGLWLGLRAPIVDGKALLVQLTQMETAPTVARVLRVDLGGRGWRGLEPHGDDLYGLAGPANDDGGFRLLRLDLPNAGVDWLDVGFGSLRPEGLVSLDEGLLAISDDGKANVGGTTCRELPSNARRARTMWVVGPAK